jgi:O-antigen/teichoic acid export membrane protein
VNETDRLLTSKSVIVKNVGWKFAEKFSSQVVSFVITIVLARILMPEDYGLVAMLMVFISILNVFVEHGVGMALIQKKKADNVDFSSMLFFNFGFSLAIYILIIFFAPFISSFYSQDLLVPMMRVLGLSVVLASIKSVLLAYVARKMVFKKTALATFGALLISGIVSITMAIFGFGAWSIIAQFILFTLFSVIFTWVSIKWKPKLVFSINSIKELFRFGWKLLFAALLNSLLQQSRNLIVGKYYTASDLGYLSRGQSFPQLISVNIAHSISSVLFSASSRLQNDKIRLKELSRKTIRITSFIMFPLLFGLAAIAEPLVYVLLTDKWILCVPYIQIFCFSYLVVIIQISVQDTINALGRSDLFLYMDIIRKTVGFSILIAVYNQGVLIIALTTFITGPIALIMSVLISRKIYGYRLSEHLKDNIPLLFVASIMALSVYSVSFIGFLPIITLFVQITLGIIIYFYLSKLFKFEGYELLIEYSRKLIKR